MTGTKHTLLACRVSFQRLLELRGGEFDMYFLLMAILLLSSCTSIDDNHVVKESYLSTVISGYEFKKTDDLAIGRIQYFGATEINPCSYWTYFPSTIRKDAKTTLFVIPRAGALEESKVKDSLLEVVSYLEKYKMPGLIVNINKGGIKLTEQDMKSRSQSYSRADLHVYDAIFNQYLPLIRASGYNINEKIFLNGYSGAGSFAYKLALFYPEKVLGVVFGGASFAPMPLSEYQTKKVSYPIGLYDLQRYTGKSYDIENYRNIKFVQIRGEKDKNQIINHELYGDYAMSYFSRKFSSDPNTREKMMAEVYRDAGLDFSFYTYPNSEHAIDMKIFHQQTFDIFKEISDKMNQD
jgi:hypothetical protein